MSQTDTRTKILDAALDLFSVAGYEGVSMKKLAGAVGIKDSSIYKHFAGKQEIFDTLLKRMNTRLEETAAFYQLPQGEVDQLAAEYGRCDLIWLKEACKAMFLFLWKDPDVSKFRRMLVIEQYKNQNAADAFRTWFIDDAVHFQTLLFEEMIRQGFFKSYPVKTMAMQFYAPFYFLLSRYDGIPEKEEEALELLMAHVEQFAAVYQIKEKGKTEGTSYEA